MKDKIREFESKTGHTLSILVDHSEFKSGIWYHFLNSDNKDLFIFEENDALNTLHVGSSLYLPAECFEYTLFEDGDHIGMLVRIKNDYNGLNSDFLNKYIDIDAIVRDEYNDSIGDFFSANDIMVTGISNDGFDLETDLGTNGVHDLLEKFGIEYNGNWEVILCEGGE